MTLPIATYPSGYGRALARSAIDDAGPCHVPGARAGARPPLPTCEVRNITFTEQGCRQARRTSRMGTSAPIERLKACGDGGS